VDVETVVRGADAVTDAELNSSLGAAARMLGESRLGEAESILRGLFEEYPQNPFVLQLLGILSMKHDRLVEAEGFFRGAIGVKPDYVEARNNLGIVLRKQERFGQAVEAYDEALKFRPEDADILNNLGNALQDAGEGARAVETYRRALVIRPGYPEFLHNLALALQIQGSAREAAEIFGKLARLAPEPTFHTNRLFTLHFDPDASAKQIFEEHLEWDRRFAAPLRGEIRGHQNNRDPSWKLRVGYVSGDFRRHSVAFFIQPLLANHDREKFEIVAYSTSTRTDDITEKARQNVALWRDISEIDVAEAAEMVRSDQIDILVDLAGHTEGSRLLVFARKPAPVQVSYLGYSDTTGLSVIDYRLSDGYLDPPGAEKFYSERLIRLPRTFACYRPPEDAPGVSASPAASSGGVTFASFNNISKVNPRLLDCWAQIVSQVSGSRFLMAAHGMQSRETRGRVESIFGKYGVSADRLRLLPRQSWEEYFALHHQCDILLDTFPVCGHTVTCHALWMGLPVITLGGKTCSQRLGVSVLSNLNLESLIARDLGEYQRVAAELGKDIPRLVEMRGSLRQRMVDSPLMDARGLAREIEGAYRSMWEIYCGGESAQS
jgi:protein O-GlcNAc transferase